MNSKRLKMNKIVSKKKIIRLGMETARKHVKEISKVLCNNGIINTCGQIKNTRYCMRAFLSMVGIIRKYLKI